MSWGWRIFLVICVFVVFILFMVFKAVRQEFHLVTDDYYEKEIRYQGEIDRIRNARTLQQQILIEYKPALDLVRLTYPENQKDAIKGKIYFFRPSDSGEDQEFIIDPDENGVQVIHVKSLKKGLWQLKINWTYGAMNYQEEKNLILQ
jgi:hypothetical protein